MASEWIYHNQQIVTAIDYSIVDGKPYGLQVGDKVLLDTWSYPPERPIIEQDGWKEQLVGIVRATGMAEKENPPAYIQWLKEQPEWINTVDN